jgi:hypothetical protein
MYTSYIIDFNKFALPISAYVLIIISFSAGCSSGEKLKKLTNDDLFNFLRGVGAMKPLSVESRFFLLKKFAKNTMDMNGAQNLKA